MPRYNFALIPVDCSSDFISCASKLSYRIQKIDKYRLKKGSVPHVTIAQFDEEGNLDDLVKKLKELNLPESVQVSFSTLRNNISHGLNWYSAMPNEITELHEIHKKVLTVIKDPKSFHGKDYDPHLTLLYSRDLQKSDNTIKLDIPIKDNFIFAIIDRNEVGQAFKIIKELEVKPVHKFLPSKL